MDVVEAVVAVVRPVPVPIPEEKRGKYGLGGDELEDFFEVEVKVEADKVGRPGIEMLDDELEKP